MNTRHILNRSIISTSSPLRYSVVTFNDWPSTSSTRSWIGLDGRKTNLLKSYSNKRGELYMLNLNANMTFGTDKPFNQFYPHQSIYHWLVVIMVLKGELLCSCGYIENFTLYRQTESLLTEKDHYIQLLKYLSNHKCMHSITNGNKCFSKINSTDQGNVYL